MRSLLRAGRSFFFFAVYGLFLVFVYGLVQRLLVWPLTLLLPERRVAIMGAWFRFLARSTVGLARVCAGVKLTVEGRIPAGSHVFVMNHQSLLDIPIAHAQMSDPYPLIPTRARYARGIPGVSLNIRLGRYPLIRQTKESRRQDLVAIAQAADAVARGELSILIYPEGHRTRDGEIGPFMTAGLRSILLRAKRPVYLLVVDGFWRARTTAEGLLHFAGQKGALRIVGPLAPPDERSADAFVQELRERMVAELQDMRGQAVQGRAEMAK
jgi:1-acyl-sn-glycerol-3-phosphate acyltransferase